MGFLWQRSIMIAIALIIVLGACAIALARPHPVRTHLGSGVAMQPPCVRRHLQIIAEAEPYLRCGG
jgi:hypothetical protein